MDNPGFFAILPASVRYDRRLKPAEKIFYAEITSLADEAGVRDRYGYMAAVLEQSILRGWEGLFALKDDFVDTVPTQRPASTEDRPREIGPDTDILDFL